MSSISLDELWPLTLVSGIALWLILGGLGLFMIILISYFLDKEGPTRKQFLGLGSLVIVMGPISFVLILMYLWDVVTSDKNLNKWWSEYAFKTKSQKLKETKPSEFDFE